MSLVDGTVLVDDDGNVTGSGFARSIFDAFAPFAQIDAFRANLPEGAKFLATDVAKKLAETCNALAATLNAQTRTATVLVTGVMSGGATAPGTLT